jgi:hypothetical protein
VLNVRLYAENWRLTRELEVRGRLLKVCVFVSVCSSEQPDVLWTEKSLEEKIQSEFDVRLAGGVC